MYEYIYKVFHIFCSIYYARLKERDNATPMKNRNNFLIEIHFHYLKKTLTVTLVKFNVLQRLTIYVSNVIMENTNKSICHLKGINSSALTVYNHGIRTQSPSRNEALACSIRKTPSSFHYLLPTSPRKRENVIERS